MIVPSIIEKSQLESALRIDAEYYQLEYLDINKKIETFGFNTLQQLSTIDITKGETPLWRGDDYLEQGIPFLRSENLVPAGLDLSDLVFISEKVNKRMKRSKIYPNDVLIAIVGATIGQTGLVTNEYKQYNSNQANAIIRPENERMANYISIILESKICQKQIERLKGGGSRDNLDLHEVKVIKIPKVQRDIISFCSNHVNEIKKLEKECKNFYSQAKSLLLEELKLKNIEFESEIWSVVKFSEARAVNRIDAEYYQPKYDKLISKIKNQNAKLLGDLVSVKKGIEPGAEEYQDEGKLFIRVSSLSKDGITDKDQKYLSSKLYQELKKDFEPKIGEILLTKDATPGIAYVLKEPAKGIISGGILKLIPKEDTEAEYLSLCINSIVGKMQVEREAGGSIISHWKPDRVKRLLIPILSVSIQQKIADLVKKSHQARRKSQGLLEEAKIRIERIIEGGGD